MKHRDIKGVFFLKQYFKIRLDEGVYKYEKKLDTFPFLLSFFTLLKYFFHFSKALFKDNKIKEGYFPYFVYVETLNQKNAIIDVFSLLTSNQKRETVFVNQNVEIEEYINVSFPRAKMFLNAISYLPKSYKATSAFRRRKKGIINQSHSIVMLSVFFSAVNEFSKMLSIYKTKKVVLTNDHNLNNLALLFASRELKIPSYYIQHAAVSPAFSVQLATDALLEGSQAVDTYKQIGNFAQRNQLVGIPRLDGFIGGVKKENKDLITIGFCLKPHYSNELIEDYLQLFLKAKNVEKIILRPHPGQTQKFYEILKKYNLEISNARKERPHQFISRVDVLVSGESSVILESSIMRVKTLYIDDKGSPYDLYGFVKNGIAIPVDEGNIVEVIESDDNESVEKCFQNCKYYCDTVGTPNENKSKELIYNIIYHDK